MEIYLLNFRLALQGIFQNKLRSFLTALGIIFGVAAVIAMLGIGSGAKQSIIDQLSLIGANSIVVNAKMPDVKSDGESDDGTTTNTTDAETQKGYTPGLSLEDMLALEKIMPTTNRISPEIVQDMSIIRDKTLQRARCVGITNDFFDINNLEVGAGRGFQELHFEKGTNVCIIGAAISTRLFKGESPLGKQIKCGNVWFTVIGILKSRRIQKSKIEELSIRDYNDDVFIPISTFLLRIDDRKRIDESDISRNERRDRNDQLQNYHQIDRAVVRISEPEYVEASAELISRILKRRHNDKIDFEIEVPELLLKQQQRTQETFNFVLAVIAGISLLVGGIDIMNIMLASVLERIKEIGIRRSLGAKKKDVILQFLFEAISISLIGGLIGVALGVIAAKVIASSADIPTVITWWSIVISFVVAAGIGLIFGLLPARRAANLDPITALRTD
ncbi:MAG: ABC transporter permease [Saprospiraceae bacterium]|nr:ABC transporter permease [Saprospiraceae bacterium]